MANRRVAKAEATLRFLALLLTMATAILIATNKETEEVFGMIKRTANVHSLQAFVVLLTTHSVATGYLLAQLCKGYLLSLSKASCGPFTIKGMAWINFALDQGLAYATFAVTTAATQGSYFAVTGERQFQWLKLCNIYKGYCDRVAAALFCGLAASFLIAVTASVSAYRLFRLYSGKRPEPING